MKPKVIIPPVGRVQLTPLNSEQAQYLSALQTSDQVFCLGKAGTGKTFMPVAYAADLIIAKKIKTLRLARPAVAAGGERLGYLPGELEEKLAPWVLPIFDVLHERLGKANVDTLYNDNRIVVESFEHMRGRDYKNSFIMLDEAQNTTVEQMKLFLTRAGNGSRICVSGDLDQSDIKGRNGLEFALEVIDKQDLPVEVVHLQKVERSGICSMWAEAFESVVGS